MKVLPFIVAFLAASMAADGNAKEKQTRSGSNLSRKLSRVLQGRGGAAVSLGLGILGLVFGFEGFMDEEYKCSLEPLFPTDYGTSMSMRQLKSYVSAYKCDCLTTYGRSVVGDIMTQIGGKFRSFVASNEGRIKYDDNLFSSRARWPWNGQKFPVGQRICQIFNSDEKSLMSRWKKRVKPLEYLYCRNDNNGYYSTPVLCNKKWERTRRCPHVTSTLNSKSPGGSEKFNSNFKNFIETDVIGYLANRLETANSKGNDLYNPYTDHSRCDSSSRCHVDGNAAEAIFNNLGLCDDLDWDWSHN